MKTSTTQSSVGRVLALSVAVLAASLLAAPAQALTPTPPPAPSTKTTKTLQLVTNVDESENVKPPYSLSIHAPALQYSDGSGDAHTKAFNTRVVALVQAQIDDVRKAAAESALTGTEAMTSSLWLSYTTYAVTKRFVSLRIDVSPYTAGAAHPNLFSVPLNFDMRTNRLIALRELFAPRSAYLKALSVYCVAELKKRDALQFPEGALPTEANYKHWAATSKGLVITFDPYQVAPWAAGPQEVVVPYSALVKLLRRGSAVYPVVP